MHLVVDHARQQPLAAGIDHGVTFARRKVGGDFFNAALVDAQIRVPAAPFADQFGVDDKNVIHRMSPE